MYLCTQPNPFLHFDVYKILVTENVAIKIKIGDPGISSHEDVETKRITYAFHPRWAAPEVLQCSEYNSNCGIFFFSFVLLGILLSTIRYMVFWHHCN